MLESNVIKMDRIILEGTVDTPQIDFNPNGEIMMAGRSLPEDPNVFYEPLFQWANDVNTDTIIIQFKMEYFNTASSKKIYDLIKTFAVNQSVKKVVVKWHYEEGDYDSKETGEHYASLLNAEFEFIECAETEF